METDEQVERITLDSIYSPHVRQRQFLDAISDHDFVLYGGAAGGGKSSILRWALLSLAIKWGSEGVDGVRVGLFSLDYPTLHDRQLSKIRAEFPDWLGSFSEKDREFKLNTQGRGVLCFRNLDDPSRYKSSEFAAIGIEELTEHEESLFDDLRWRMRWPGIERPKFLGATNPTGVGLAWVKRLWVDRDFPPHLQAKQDQFAYIPAKAYDNPHLPVSYVATLESLPPLMRAALLDGSWDIFAGQVFSEFRRDVHTCRPFAIPSHWTVWASNDPGFADPGVWYILAANQDGDCFVVEEMTFERTPYSQQASAFAAKCKELGLKPRYIVTGMDAFIKHPETGKGHVDYYQEGGLQGFTRPDHGTGARARMAGVVHELLKLYTNSHGVDASRLKIFDTCKRLISTLPTLPCDELHPEQVAECANDHWYQAVGYGLQSRYGMGSGVKFETSATAEAEPEDDWEED